MNEMVDVSAYAFAHGVRHTRATLDAWQRDPGRVLGRWVAGSIAGSSLPLQAQHRQGVSRWVHEHGGRLAIAFVIAATTFSLSAQAYLIGRALGGVSGFLGVSPGLLLLSVLPHALIELIALFLPLAAWIIAS